MDKKAKDILGSIKRGVASRQRKMILSLCSPGEATSEILCPLLSSSVQKRQRSPREFREEPQR